MKLMTINIQDMSIIDSVSIEMWFDWCFFCLKVAHVFSILLLFAAMFGVLEAFYNENPDVHSAGTIYLCIDPNGVI